MSPCVHRSSHGSACPNFSVKRCGRVLIANKQANSGVVWWRTLDTIAHHIKHWNFCRAREIGVERGLVLYCVLCEDKKKKTTAHHATATEPAGPRPRSSSPSLLKRIMMRASVRGRVPILFSVRFSDTDVTRCGGWMTLSSFVLDLIEFSSKTSQYNKLKMLISIPSISLIYYTTEKKFHVPLFYEYIGPNQSINQPIHQLIKQTNNESIHQSINQTINQSIKQLINQSINPPISRSINQQIINQ